jgi:S-adenosylmethionine hydrolase
VLFRDPFGNLVTNLSAEQIASLPRDSWTLELAGTRIDGLVQTYGERPPASLVALVGSTGWIEIAVVNGDAASQLMAGPGTTVWLRKK